MPDKKADDELLAELARKLREKFQEVHDEPIPADIEELLKLLEAKHTTTS